MNLAPGLRISGGEGSIYEVGEPAFRTSSSDFSHATKIFRDFRLDDPKLYEAAPDEGLRVLLRVARAPNPPDLDFELGQVLTIPEVCARALRPIDRIDLEGMPALVLDAPAGKLSTIGPRDATRLVKFAREALELLAALHARKLAAGGLQPSQFVECDSRGWTFLGTGSVIVARSEADFQADITAWEVLCRGLLDSRDDDPKSGTLRWLVDSFTTIESKNLTSASELLATAGRPSSAFGRLLGFLGHRGSAPGNDLTRKGNT